MPGENEQIDGPGRDDEGEGQDRSRGLPADGPQAGEDNELLGTTVRAHRHESPPARPSLEERGGVVFAAAQLTRTPMVLTDPRQADNPIIFANKAFLDLTGYDEAEVLGRNCRFLQGANTDGAHVAALREAVAMRQAIALEILNYKRDGTPFWNAVVIGPVDDADGEPLFFFASQIDVTRRRAFEQTYRQAERMESIRDVTAGLAHDFNNLLQAVNGNLELLEGHVSGDQAERLLGSARSALAKGAKLTSQLLAFARKTRLEPRAVDLTDLVTAYAPLAENTLGPSARLTLQLRRPLPPVWVDPDQFEMALLNILTNSRDAMPGGGTVTLSTYCLHLDGNAAARELTPGAYVAFEVRDTGYGMSPHVAQKATEPFFTTKGLGMGAGLGLAMASGFAQQSRGRLEIESEEGVGTTVRLLFPGMVTPGEPSPVPGPSISRSVGLGAGAGPIPARPHRGRLE